MSLPEISQRCLSCGASVRAGARFCPQCGAQMVADEPAVAHNSMGISKQPPERELLAKETAAEDEDDLHFEEEWKKFEERRIKHGWVETKKDDVEGDVIPLIEQEREAAPLVATSSATEMEASPPATDIAAQDVRAAQTLVTETQVSSVGASGVTTTTAEDGTDAKGGRANAAAAAVRGSVRPRVERVRAASSVVFEEASEDSGLRFVLIAALLFLLFLLFLLLSTILK